MTGAADGGMRKPVEGGCSAAGPAGAVVAFQPGALRRGTAMRAPRTARYTMHLGYWPACVERATAIPGPTAAVIPPGAGSSPAATQHLALFGFPPPGHPYWTADTVAGAARRCPPA